MSLLLNSEIPRAADAFLPTFFPLTGHLYTLSCHLLRGELNLCAIPSLSALLCSSLSSCSWNPSSAYDFRSRVCLCMGKRQRAVSLVNAPRTLKGVSLHRDSAVVISTARSWNWKTHHTIREFEKAAEISHRKALWVKKRDMHKKTHTHTHVFAGTCVFKMHIH